MDGEMVLQTAQYGNVWSSMVIPHQNCVNYPLVNIQKAIWKCVAEFKG